jgi:hypothetical protein
MNVSWQRRAFDGPSPREETMGSDGWRKHLKRRLAALAIFGALGLGAAAPVVASSVSSTPAASQWQAPTTSQWQ